MHKHTPQYCKKYSSVWFQKEPMQCTLVLKGKERKNPFLLDRLMLLLFVRGNVMVVVVGGWVGVVGFITRWKKERERERWKWKTPLISVVSFQNFCNRWRALSSPMFPVSSPSIRHSLLGHYLTTTITTTPAPTPMRKPNPSPLTLVCTHPLFTRSHITLINSPLSLLHIIVNTTKRQNQNHPWIRSSHLVTTLINPSTQEREKERGFIILW